MQAVILAGGLGTRLSEETTNQPKPMVQIGDRPIIWHIMKSFSHYGIKDFIICCGYKGYVLKEYFANYYLHNSDFTIDLKSNSTEILSKQNENIIIMGDTNINTEHSDDYIKGNFIDIFNNYENLNMDNIKDCYTYNGLLNNNIKNKSMNSRLDRIYFNKQILSIEEYFLIGKEKTVYLEKYNINPSVHFGVYCNFKIN